MNNINESNNPNSSQHNEDAVDGASFDASAVKSTYVAEYEKDIKGKVEQELGSCGGNPITLLNDWLNKAVESNQFEDPHAMQLATVNRAGQPSARTVLLRFANEKGIGFCTDSGSDKAKQIGENPKVAIVIYWDRLQRQVRVEGEAVRDDLFADKHFDSRKKESKIVAITCRQSTPIGSRSELIKNFQEASLAYSGTDTSEIPRPEHWVGYRIVPHQFEFWRGHKSRLNERVQLVKDGEKWNINILQPH